MEELVSVLLQRDNPSTPWGFRIQKGDSNNGYPLFVHRVTPGTVAFNCLRPGDVVLKIGSKSARDLINADTDDLITKAGNCLELIIKKRPSGSNNPASPLITPTPNSRPTPFTPFNPNAPSTPGTPAVGTPKFTPFSPLSMNNQAPTFSPPPPLFPTSPPTFIPSSLPTPPPPMFPSDSPPNFTSLPTPPPPTPPPMGSPLSGGPPKFPSPGSTSPVFAPPPPPPLPNAQIPPPPPPINNHEPEVMAPWRLRQVRQEAAMKDPNFGLPPQKNVNAASQYENLPAALHGTLMKDKKPFTYTPGGIDLSEIRSPRMQRRLHYNQMDPPGNLARLPASPLATNDNSYVVSTDGAADVSHKPAPPPETYPQPRIPLLPSVQPQTRVPLPQPVPPPAMPPQPLHLPPVIEPPRQQSPASAQKQQVIIPSQYNSPLGLYSNENATKMFRAQAADITSELENLNVNKAPSNVTSTPAQTQKEEEEFQPYYKGQHPQSRSFRLLQVMTDTTTGEQEEVQNAQKRNENDEMRFTGLRRNPIPSRAFHTLQRMTGEENGDRPPVNVINQNTQDHEASPARSDGELRYRGAYIPSRSFKLLQEMTGGSDEDVPPSPRGTLPRKTATVTMQVSPQRSPAPTPTPQVPPSEQQMEAEPRKYMGGHIPSRSFRMLQAMTGGDDDYDYGKPETNSHPIEQEQPSRGPRMYMGSNIPSRSFKMLQAMTEPAPNGVPHHEDGTDF